MWNQADGDCIYGGMELRGWRNTCRPYYSECAHEEFRDGAIKHNTVVWTEIVPDGQPIHIATVEVSAGTVRLI